MARLTLGFGALLIVVGVGAYLGTGGESVTALIPAFAGIPMLAAGYLQTIQGWETRGAYAALALAVILALGTVRGVSALADGSVTTASVVNTILLVLSLIFLVAGVQAVRGQARA